jgi:prevent-host-death family protein
MAPKHRKVVKSTVTISELRAGASKCVRRAEQQGAVTVCRHGRVVAFLISRDRLEAIIETLEILGNSKAMAAIKKYEGGKANMKDVSCLKEANNLPQ